MSPSEPLLHSGIEARSRHPRVVAGIATALYLVGAAGFFLLTEPASGASPGTLAPARAALPALSIVVGAVLVFSSIWLVLVWRRREELGWRHVAWSLGDVAWLSDHRGERLRFLNEASERVFGKKVADMLSDRSAWHDVVHPQHRERVQAWRSSVRSGGDREIEYAVVRPDGSQRWLRDRAAAITDVAGMPIGLGGIAQDITDTRMAAQREREQRMRLEGILATATEAIVTVDRSQTVRMFNNAASRMFGIPVADALGLPLSALLPGKFAQLHRAHVDEFAQSRKTRRPMGQAARLLGTRSDGLEFPVEVSISQSGAGDELMMTAVIRDATEAEQVEEARRAQHAAEAAGKAKAEFLSRMSHEMRTPLNAILGFAQLLRGNEVERLTRKQDEGVGYVQSSARHLLALINDVLDLSRTDAAPSRDALESVSLRDALKDAVAMCIGLRDRFNVNLVVESAPADIVVLGDGRRLRQVLINLLSNAFKYNRPAGEIRVRMQRGVAHADIEIQDTGVGMTPEQIQHLFEPFNRLGRERSSIEGTGIGLLLTRELVHAMEGHLEVDSALGEGTRMRVTLRLADEAVQPTQPAPLPVFEQVAAPSGTVLYIEDNEFNAALIREIVALLPTVRYVHAVNGLQGIEAARTTSPSLILLDMHFPDMDGIAVLKKLKSDALTAHIPVVMFSASDQQDELAAAEAAGAIAYWTKPLDCEEVLKNVSSLLRRRP